MDHEPPVIPSSILYFIKLLTPKFNINIVPTKVIASIVNIVLSLFLHKFLVAIFISIFLFLFFLSIFLFFDFFLYLSLTLVASIIDIFIAFLITIKLERNTDIIETAKEYIMLGICIVSIELYPYTTLKPTYEKIIPNIIPTKVPKII
ncbi:hypothetical protein SDC9_110668 [bioreactor metagenome]|uniref:Uncharacterized protein n=1 Tax=bioreactor metagenome TaxID=1076179 RepID=A0A645BPR1_9ZZZZ